MHDASEKTPHDTATGPSATRNDKTERNGTGAEADDGGDGPDKLQNLAKSSPRLKRKRVWLDPGKKAALKRRGQRPWLLSLSSLSSSSSSSEEEGTDSGLESDVCSQVPAKLHDASNFLTSTSSPLSSSSRRRFNIDDSSKNISICTRRRPASLTALSQKSQAQCTAHEEQEWEISKVVDKGWARKGYEYKVRWTDTRLPKRELGNARRLLREFEVRPSVK